MALSETDKGLLIQAMCCVVATDGRVSGREIAVIAEALTKGGCPTTREEIRPLVIEMSKQILARGVRPYTDSLTSQLARLRETNNGSVLEESLDALIRADGKTTEQETEIVRKLRGAVAGGSVSPNTPPRDAPLAARLRALPEQTRWYTPLLATGGLWVAALAMLMIARGCVAADTKYHKMSRRMGYESCLGFVDYVDDCETRYRKTGSVKDLGEWQKQAGEAGRRAMELRAATVVGIPSAYPIWVSAITGAVIVAAVALFWLYKPPSTPNKLETLHIEICVGFSTLLLLALVAMLVALFLNSNWYEESGATAAETGGQIARAARHIEAILAERVRLGGDFERLIDGKGDDFWPKHKELVARSNPQVDAIMRGIEYDDALPKDIRVARIKEEIEIQSSSRARCVNELVARGALVSGRAANLPITDVQNMLTSAGWLKGNGRIWRFKPDGGVVYEEPGGTVDESKKWTLLSRNEETRCIAVMVHDAFDTHDGDKRRWEFVFNPWDGYAEVKTFKDTEVMSEGIFTAVR